MAEALDAAIQARESQQLAALAGKNKSPVQLEIHEHEWEYDYDIRRCKTCHIEEVCND